jgi:GT2 family glycosyltransferase
VAVEAQPQAHFRKGRVLVSVLSYNSVQNTILTLRSLLRQTYRNCQIQIVDNASTDETRAEIRKEFPQLEMKVLPSNLGYTGGSNFVLKQALGEGYDFALLCNHDIELDELAVEQLVDTAETKGDAGVVGAIEVSAKTGKRHASGGGKYLPWISRLSWLTVTTNDPAVQVDCVHGALILFTRRALVAGIAMDENLFMYMDEVDLGFRLKARSLRAYTDQRVCFIHKSEPYRLERNVGYLSQRNRLYLVRKYGKWYQRIFYYGYSILIELPAKIIIRTLQGNAPFARACLTGFVDGWRGRMGRGRLDEL